MIICGKNGIVRSDSKHREMSAAFRKLLMLWERKALQKSSNTNVWFTILPPQFLRALPLKQLNYELSPEATE